MNERTKLILKITALSIVAFISFFVISNYASNPISFKEIIQHLDDKKTTVLELTAASAATSAAITLIPGDVATPIADKLADLSTYFLIVVGAIYLEKYLLTITGFLTFKLLIPIGCILWIIHLLFKNEMFLKTALKLMLFGTAIFVSIPASVHVSNMIEDTYSSSIQATIDEANNTANKIETEDKGLIDGIVNGVSNTVDSVKESINHFIEALAIMIVTSCVIPIFVLLFMMWAIKLILGIDLQLPKYSIKRITSNNKQLTKNIESDTL